MFFYCCELFGSFVVVYVDVIHLSNNVYGHIGLLILTVSQVKM